MPDPDFTIYNPNDCSVKTANDGDTVHLNMPVAQPGVDAPSEMCFYVRAEATQITDVWAISTLENINFNQSGNVAVGQWLGGTDPAKPVLAGMFNSYGKTAGTCSTASLTIGSDSVSFTSGPSTTLYPVPQTGKMVRLIFHWVTLTHLIKPVSWMPVSPFDLQWDLDSGAVRSASIARLLEGIKQGSDVEFAALPFLAGALVTDTDLSLLSLSIRPTVDLNDYGKFAFDATAVEWVALSAGHGYYRINFNLGGGKLSDAFDDLNEAIDDAIAANGNAGQIEAVAAAASKIACQLEMRATHTDGIFTSRNVPLTILQALT